MTLEGMLGEVTRLKVAGLLEERPPRIVESNNPADVARFEARVTGAAAAVVLLVGSDPVAGPIRDMAVECITLQTASEIEYAEFPEQNAPGDTNRGYHLHQLYLEQLSALRKVLENLGGVPPDGGTGGVITTSKPKGRFPAPSPYPDPVRDFGRRFR